MSEAGRRPEDSARRCSRSRAECVLRERAGARGRQLQHGSRVGRGRRSERHGQDDAVQRDHRASRRRAPTGSILFEGERARRRPVVQDRAAWDRLRPAGPAPVPVAHGRRAPHDRVPRWPSTNGTRAGRASASTSCFRAWRERKRNGGAQLSGGEQQMLAIGRALVTNPKILVMDEPSEGLAPAVIEGLIETFRRLEEEGLAILLIEQNLGVATALAERQLVMVGGRDRGSRRPPAELASDPEMQRQVPRRRARRALGSPSSMRSGASRACSWRSSGAILSAGCGGRTRRGPISRSSARATATTRSSR